MFARLRFLARSVVQSLGYDVHRLRAPFADIRAGLSSNSRPIIFDVGANIGQTIQRLRAVLPFSVIHAFEPAADTFRELAVNVAGANGIHLNNIALGAERETRELIEMEVSVHNSFLELDEDGYGVVKSRTPIRISTIDHYCRIHNIDQIDVLKTDTQGFDLNVLKGAAGMFAKRSVRFVLVEVNFDKWYKGAARPDEIFRFLYERGFRLVSFYQFHYDAHGFSVWADALFRLRS